MASNWEKRAGTRPARASQDAPLADVRSGARAVCPGLVLTRSGPRRAPSGEWRPAGRASGPAPVGGPVRRRAPVRPRPGPSGCVRPRPGPDLPSGAPSGTGLVASMLASARRRAPSGAKFPRPEVSVGRPVRRRRPDRTSGRGPSTDGAGPSLVGVPTRVSPQPWAGAPPASLGTGTICPVLSGHRASYDAKYTLRTGVDDARQSK